MLDQQCTKLTEFSKRTFVTSAKKGRGLKYYPIEATASKTPRSVLFAILTTEMEAHLHPTLLNG
jgi:hypothetical protein